MEIILGKTSGFCFGVKSAISGAEKELEKNKKLYCLGEIIHNEEVVKSLEKKGLITVNSLKDVSNKALIRAHGVSKDTYEYAKNNNIELIDFTCPFVLKIHDQVSTYSHNNYFIFLLGIKNHPETIGTISFCGNNSYLIENLDDIPNAINTFNKSNLTNALIISQTTFSVSLFNEIVNKIKNTLPNNINLEIKNTICNTTQIRQKETEEIAKQVDLMIVIGGKNSSNTKKLYEISQKYCNSVYLVQTSKDLISEHFQDTNKIGIIAGASTPQNIIDDIVSFCKK